MTTAHPANEAERADAAREAHRLAGDAHQTSGMLYLTLAMALYVLTGYGITITLARLLGPSGLGTYGVAVAVITVLQMMVVRGIPAAMSAEIAAAPGDARQTFFNGARVAAGMAIAIALVLGGGSRLLAAALGDDQLVVPFEISALSGCTFGLQALLLAYLNGRQRFRRQALGEGAFALVRLATIVGGAVWFGIHGALAGYVLAPLIAAAAAFVPIRDAHSQPASAPPVDPGALLRRALPMAATASAISLLLVGDLLAFKRVGASVDVGIYNAAETIAQVPFLLLNAAVLVLLPSVAALAASPAAERLAVVRRGFGDAWVLLALPTAVLVTIGDPALHAIFGDRFATEVTIVAPLALATVGITLHSIFVAIEAGLGRLREALMIGALGIIAMFAAVIVAGEGSNLEGAAWAVVVVTAGVAITHGALLRVRVGAYLEIRRLAGSTVLASALALAASASPTSLPWLALDIVVATACYIVVCLATGLLRLRPGATPNRT